MEERLNRLKELHTRIGKFRQYDIDIIKEIIRKESINTESSSSFLNNLRQTQEKQLNAYENASKKHKDSEFRSLIRNLSQDFDEEIALIERGLDSASGQDK